MTIYSLDVFLSDLEPVCCSVSNFLCYFLTCIQVSQEAGQVVWYSHLLKNFLVYFDPHSQRLWHSQWSRSRCFSGIPLHFQWSNGCWQFDLWFLCFLNPLWTSGSSSFTYCWSLAWRILSIALLPCKMSTIVLISHASKIMLKTVQARLQQYVNWEISDVQCGFNKGRGTRDPIANIHWIIEKAKEFQKTICFSFIDYAMAFDCVNHNKLWKILRDGNTRPPYLSPDKPICRSRSNN